MMFNDIYKHKKVLITGHTGFKGSWLTTWLLQLGADVIGISKDIPTNPSMFEELGLEANIQHNLEDICNFEALHQIINREKPDFIFHLAAQAIVSTSYSRPLETISSNVIGTTHILESLRLLNYDCTLLIVTSDKAYDNVEQVWGYKEDDRMGGKDVYSGSKGAAELVIKAYFNSFFQSSQSNVRLAVARAGNVIGGGDWAKDRIIVDAMIAWSKGEKVDIRSPRATRPWQHVLEPLSGYLTLAQQLQADLSLNGEGFNFGPRAEQNGTVQELLEDSCKYWGLNEKNAFTVTENCIFKESSLLKLNCDKALSFLKWTPNLEYNETIKFTNQWYFSYYNRKQMFDYTTAQIQEYQDAGIEKNLIWTE
ncbi:MAG: CDP-glucose 4,6-dehydratase [Paracoccaceae bacterium]